MNRGCSYREQVGARAAGRRAVDYLAASRRHSSGEAWAERFDRGEVEIEGQRANAGAVLRAGQTLVWHRPPWAEPPVPLHFEVIHLEDAFLAVAKPRGLPTMPAGGFLEHTLLALVRARYPGARLLHRLGRHTSGLVLFARTAEAASRLGRAWRARAVTKVYRALGSGVAHANRLDITIPIGPVPHPRLGHVHAAAPGGRPAHSVAHVMERRAGSTLFQVTITTGRPHQIRIHLAWAGHPLVGDPLYAAGGTPGGDEPALPGDGGYLLHAERLQFAHPQSHDQVTLVAPPPDELRAPTD